MKKKAFVLIGVDYDSREESLLVILADDMRAAQRELRVEGRSMGRGILLGPSPAFASVIAIAKKEDGIAIARRLSHFDHYWLVELPVAVNNVAVASAVPQYSDEDIVGGALSG